MKRTLKNYVVQLQRDDGLMEKYPISVYWSDEWQAEVGNAAAAQAHWEGKKQHLYYPVKVERV